MLNNHLKNVFSLSILHAKYDASNQNVICVAAAAAKFKCHDCDMSTPLIEAPIIIRANVFVVCDGGGGGVNEKRVRTRYDDDDHSILIGKAFAKCIL